MVYVRRLHGNAQAAAFSNRTGHLLWLASIGNQESGNIFCRVVCLEIGSLIGNQGIADRMSFIESIAGKGFNQGKDFIRHRRRKPPLPGSG